MNFKFTLVLIVVALLVLDTDAWWRRRRRRRHSRRRRSIRRTVRKVNKWAGHVKRWAGHVKKWSGHVNKWLKMKWDVAALKELRQDNQAEYDKAIDEIRQIVSDQEGDEAAKFVVDSFDYATAENPEQVSDAKKAEMTEFMDALSQNTKSDEITDEDFI